MSLQGKVYLKQKESSIKGDWVKTLDKDFQFIEKIQNDDAIIKQGKNQYFSHIKEKVEKAAFTLYQNHIRTNKKKMKNISYEHLELQKYLNHPKFGQKEIKLMCLLRSKTHPAKFNFRKMNKNDLKCSFQCNTVETQEHIFEQCQPIHTQLKKPAIVQLSKLFGSLSEQLDIIEALMEIECIRKSMKDKSS